MRRAFSARGRARRARVAVPIIVAIAFLAVPGTAAAHSGAPTVALDFRLDLSPATRALSGVRVDLVDGDRGLRVRVDPKTELTVLGDLGEPVLRFDSSGVWVNRGSPTAAGAKLTPPSTDSATSWALRTHGHSVRWHDHRLAPPRTARAGVAGSWSIPIVLRGQRAAFAGTYVRMPRPHSWLWLGLALVLGLGVAAVAWRRPKARPALLVVCGALAAAGVLVASASFATADELGARSQWIEFGVVVALVGVAVYGVASGRRALPVWVAVGMGIVCAALSLGSLGVLWHGYVITSLPSTVTRLAVLLAVVAGTAAGLLGISVDAARVRARAPGGGARRRAPQDHLPPQRAAARARRR